MGSLAGICQGSLAEPVASAPVASAPVASAPVTSAPVTSAPVTSAPVTVEDLGVDLKKLGVCIKNIEYRHFLSGGAMFGKKRRRPYYR